MSNGNSKNTIIIVLLMGLAFVMYITNPNEYQLKDHVTKSIRIEAAESRGLEGSIRGLFAGVESWFKTLDVQRKNFVLFSVYRVDGLDTDRTYLGLFGNFIQVK